MRLPPMESDWLMKQSLDVMWPYDNEMSAYVFFYLLNFLFAWLWDAVGYTGSFFHKVHSSDNPSYGLKQTTNRYLT